MEGRHLVGRGADDPHEVHPRVARSGERRPQLVGRGRHAHGVGRGPHRSAGPDPHAVDVQVDAVALDVVVVPAAGGEGAEPDAAVAELHVAGRHADVVEHRGPVRMGPPTGDRGDPELGRSGAVEPGAMRARRALEHHLQSVRRAPGDLRADREDAVVAVEPWAEREGGEPRPRAHLQRYGPPRADRRGPRSDARRAAEQHRALPAQAVGHQSRPPASARAARTADLGPERGEREAQGVRLARCRQEGGHVHRVLLPHGAAAQHHRAVQLDLREGRQTAEQEDRRPAPG